MKGIFSIAPRAAKRATGQADKDARLSYMGGFTLNAMKNLCDSGENQVKT